MNSGNQYLEMARFQNLISIFIFFCKKVFQDKIVIKTHEKDSKTLSRVNFTPNKNYQTAVKILQRCFPKILKKKKDIYNLTKYVFSVFLSIYSPYE